MTCGRGDSIEHPLEAVPYTVDELAAFATLGDESAARHETAGVDQLSGVAALSPSGGVSLDGASAASDAGSIPAASRMDQLAPAKPVKLTARAWWRWGDLFVRYSDGREERWRRTNPKHPASFVLFVRVPHKG